MPIGVHDPGTDTFDLDVHYGGLRYVMFFGPGASMPLPGSPPPVVAGDGVCRCPSCASEGWYAESPVCGHWRRRCDACAGARSYLDYSHGRPPRRLPCDLCAQEWPRAVVWFRYSLRNPRAAARRLRERAAHARAARETTR